MFQSVTFSGTVFFTMTKISCSQQKLDSHFRDSFIDMSNLTEIIFLWMSGYLLIVKMTDDIRSRIRRTIEINPSGVRSKIPEEELSVL